MNFGAGAMGMAVILNTMGGVFAPFMTNFLGIGAGAADMGRTQFGRL